MENHMVTVHKIEKKHKCLECGKLFLIEWRLRKHVEVHTESIKTCNYFLNKIECPFEELGCKFMHDNPKNHNEDDDESPKENEDDDESAKEENFCYFCKQDFDDPKSLDEHPIQQHMDRFTRN